MLGFDHPQQGGEKFSLEQIRAFWAGCLRLSEGFYTTTAMTNKSGPRRPLTPYQRLFESGYRKAKKGLQQSNR